jgi:hypothetical protein
MPFDPHERARFLIDESRVAGISKEDTQWLREHLAECAECVRQEETTARMLQAMSELSFGGVRPPIVPAARLRSPWWPVAAAAALLIAAIPIYRARIVQEQQADVLLLERVEAGISRDVPQALEPLLHPENFQ